MKNCAMLLKRTNIMRNFQVSANGVSQKRRPERFYFEQYFRGLYQ